MNGTIEINMIRPLVRGAYQLQKLRIQMGNRIVGNYKVKLGQEPGAPEEELSDESQDILKKLRDSYKRITDGVVSARNGGLPKTFEGDGVIDTFAELVLIDQYMRMDKDETDMFGPCGRIANVLKMYPIWTDFLSGVYGCGPAMGGVIVSEIDIHKSKYPSSLWKLSGLDVAQDGKGRSRKAEHLVEQEYTDKEGELKTKKGITFNPFLKTKLMGVLASSFLKCGSKSPYSKIYYDYRNRLENNTTYKDATKGHRHNMAMRYMIKRFLVDLYTAWRALEGLPVAEPYETAKLGYHHGQE